MRNGWKLGLGAVLLALAFFLNVGSVSGALTYYGENYPSDGGRDGTVSLSSTDVTLIWSDIYDNVLGDGADPGLYVGTSVYHDETPRENKIGRGVLYFENTHLISGNIIAAAVRVSRNPSNNPTENTAFFLTPYRGGFPLSFSGYYTGNFSGGGYGGIYNGSPMANDENYGILIRLNQNGIGAINRDGATVFGVVDMADQPTPWNEIMGYSTSTEWNVGTSFYGGNEIADTAQAHLLIVTDETPVDNYQPWYTNKTLTLDTDMDNGLQGTEIILSGEGYTVNDNNLRDNSLQTYDNVVTIFTSDNTSFMTYPDENGYIENTYTVPSTKESGDMMWFYAYDNQKDENSYYTFFYVTTSTLVMSPENGAVGTTLHFTGYGFSSDNIVGIWFSPYDLNIWFYVGTDNRGRIDNHIRLPLDFYKGWEQYGDNLYVGGADNVPIVAYDMGTGTTSNYVHFIITGTVPPITDEDTEELQEDSLSMILVLLVPMLPATIMGVIIKEYRLYAFLLGFSLGTLAGVVTGVVPLWLMIGLVVCITGIFFLKAVMGRG